VLKSGHVFLSIGRLPLPLSLVIVINDISESPDICVCIILEKASTEPYARFLDIVQKKIQLQLARPIIQDSPNWQKNRQESI
jgi:hypothetical protein